MDCSVRGLWSCSIGQFGCTSHNSRIRDSPKVYDYFSRPLVSGLPCRVAITLSGQGTPTCCTGTPHFNVYCPVTEERPKVKRALQSLRLQQTKLATSTDRMQVMPMPREMPNATCLFLSSFLITFESDSVAFSHSRAQRLNKQCHEHLPLMVFR